MNDKEYTVDTDATIVAQRGRESRVLTPRRTEYGKAVRKAYEARKLTEQRKNIQRLEPRQDGKTNCLTTVQKDNLLLTSTLRIPENTKTGYAEISPGDCVDLTQLTSKTRRGRKMRDKSNCLLTAHQLCRYEAAPRQLNHAAEYGNQPRQQNRFYDTDALSPALAIPPAGIPKIAECRYRIRRLTPTECSRLQTIPDWYEWKGLFPDGTTKPTSDTQRYKMLGNGWCVEVIKHILSFLPRSAEE